VNVEQRQNLERSKELFRQGIDVVPGGVIGVRRPAHFVPNEYPIFLESGEDGTVIDVDGNSYIDLMATYGAVVLGHRCKDVDDAAIDYIKNNGCGTTLTHPIQNELAGLLGKHVPCCDKALTVKTGSDGTMAAVRIARAYTGRNKILRCGYHGWHDWCVEVKSGVPESAYEDVLEFRYNDLDHVRDLLKAHGDEVAGIILWPIHTPLGGQLEEPKPGFLEGLRELADRYGSILIFDELRTGFRVGLGGAQRFYGVIPDVSVFGKAMGNGYPIAAIVGRAEVMKVLDNKVFLSSTYFSDPVAQSAAVKTIQVLESENVLEKLKKKGEQFATRVQKIIEESHVGCSFSGGPWFPHFLFTESSEKLNLKIRLSFYTQLIRSGVFLSPYHHGFFMSAHSESDLNYIEKSVERALAVVNDKYYG